MEEGEEGQLNFRSKKGLNLALVHCFPSKKRDPGGLYEGRVKASRRGPEAGVRSAEKRVASSSPSSLQAPISFLLPPLSLTSPSPPKSKKENSH